jgi:hypothetical protein
MLDNIGGGLVRLPDQGTRKRMAAFVEGLHRMDRLTSDTAQDPMKGRAMICGFRLPDSQSVVGLVRSGETRNALQVSSIQGVNFALVWPFPCWPQKNGGVVLSFTIGSMFISTVPDSPGPRLTAQKQRNWDMMGDHRKGAFHIYRRRSCSHGDVHLVVGASLEGQPS